MTSKMIERVMTIHQALLCIQATSQLCTSQPPYKDSVADILQVLHYFCLRNNISRSLMIIVVGIERGVCHLLFYISYALCFACFICKCIQLFKMCCFQEKYLT